MSAGFTMEMLPGEPVLFQTWLENFDFSTELAEVAQQATQILEAQPEPVFFITNMLAVKISLDNMIAGANYSVQGTNALFHHPKIRRIIFVVTNPIVRMGAKGMDSHRFGNIRIELFDTNEEALDYVRAEIAKGEE
jgi:hypothetical protein